MPVTPADHQSSTGVGGKAAPTHPSASADPIPTCPPSQVGIDARGILRLISALEAGGYDPHSLMVIRHGRVAAAGWWRPYRPADPVLGYSLSKSFTGSAVGLAISEGLLSLDSTVSEILPIRGAGRPGPRATLMTVRHLLTMSTGHEVDTLPQLDPTDPVGSFLTLEPEHDPGTLFTYNNGATLILSAILNKLTGQRVSAYLRDRLFDRIGIGHAHWLRAGEIDQGFSGLRVSTEALARLGLLHLNNGRWQGQQILPQSWVTTASSRQIDTAGRSTGIDWQQGYGFQFWMSRHGYRGDGAYGQFCIILPEYDAVVALTSATEDTQGVLTNVWEGLLPAFRSARDARSAADDELAVRLRALELPVIADASTARPGCAGTEHHAMEFKVSGPAAQNLGLTAPLGLNRNGDRWILTIREGDCEFSTPIDSTHWARVDVPLPSGGTLPLAGTGGWVDPERFRAEVAVLSTPHRLRVDVDAQRNTARLIWRTVPLHPGPLSGMGLPEDADHDHPADDC